MSNHIQNRLKITGTPEKVQEVLAAIASVEDGKTIQIDFNNIIPRPDELDIAESSTGKTVEFLLFGEKSAMSTHEAQERFASWDEAMQKEGIELALKYHQNRKKYGHATWYGWTCENWGTKWNAYQQNDKRNTEDTIYFQTAWACPVPVLVALSKMFPLVVLEVFFADEDTGSNVGSYIFREGEMFDEHIPVACSKEAFDMAFDLRPGLKERYKLVGDTYEYAGDE